MENKKIVIALGGNALGNTPQEQINNCVLTAKAIIPIIKAGYKVVLTHGNGPQVGLINLAFEVGSSNNQKVCQMPFPECGAMSQGYIGFHLQNSLYNELKKENMLQNVVPIVTRVLVDKNDSAFSNPTKPIGSFYTYEEAMTKPFPVKEDAGRGYRRVVASPKPVDILEASVVKELMKDNIVISVGGGGIPVIESNNGYEGIPAVIDKDFASSKLGELIDADILLILTAVDKVSINFNTPKQKDLDTLTLDEAINFNKNKEFKEGSMKPKIEAAINFVQSKENRVSYITSINHAYEALLGKNGTKIIQ